METCISRVMKWRGVAVAVLVALVATVLFAFPWVPNTRTIPATYQGKTEYFAKLDASMWIYMLAWGAHHPERFNDAPILEPTPTPLVANAPRLIEGIWSIPLFRVFDPVVAWGWTTWIALFATGLAAWFAGARLTGSAWGGAAYLVFFGFGSFRALHICHIEIIAAPFLPLVPLALVSLADGSGVSWRRRWAATARRVATALKGDPRSGDTSLVALNSISNSIANSISRDAVGDGRAVIGWHVAALAGMVFGLAAIDYFYFGVALGLTLPCAVIWGIVTGRIAVRNAIVAGVVAALVIAIDFAPIMIQYVNFHRITGLARSLGESDSGSADVFAWMTGPNGMLLPPFGGGKAHFLPDPRIFPGFMMLALAVVGLRTLARRSQELIVLMVMGFIASLGTMRLFFWTLGLPSPSFATPYEWLYGILLPLKGIRAPVRFAVMAHLVLALAAAFVVARMSERGKACRVAAVILLVLSFLESRQGMHALAIRTDRVDDPVYTWIGASSEDGAVLDLPMGVVSSFGLELLETEAMLTQLRHGRPTPNGTMAMLVPWPDAIAVHMQRPRPDVTRALIENLGVRWVVARDSTSRETCEAIGFPLKWRSPSGIAVYVVDSPLSVPLTPADLQERMAPWMPLSPSEPDGALNAGISMAESVVLVARDPAFVFATVWNPGPDTWTARGALYGLGPVGDVWIATRWWHGVGGGAPAQPLDYHGRPLSFSGMLQSDVAPGESGSAVLVGFAPPWRGRYRVAVDLKRQGQRWFHPRDEAPLILDVDVR